MYTPLPSNSVTSRTTAAQGEIARLFCSFSYDGRPSDPQVPPVVYITAPIAPSNLLPGSSSSSSNDLSDPNVFGPFTAVRLACGLWFIDWAVPTTITPGLWCDVWTFKWQYIDPSWESQTFGVTVVPADDLTKWDATPSVDIVSGVMREYLRLFNDSTLYDAQHQQVNWEQGQRNYDPKVITFSFKNWNTDPRPEVMVNRTLVASGWQPDYNGRIIFQRNLDPEDVVHCSYGFRYFSNDEVLSFLNMGLYMMNAIPPPSEMYDSVPGAPFPWRLPILAGAAQTALQRLVMGLSYQNRRIIFGEDQQLSDAATANFRAQYGEFKEQFTTMAKNAKTLRIPSIAAVIQPEFTLPGGRSRWFRLLFKGS